MKIIATSDTHGVLPDIPPCDLLIVAGDVCPMFSHEHYFQLPYLRNEFLPWLQNVPADNIAWTAGNHDFVLEARPWLWREMTCGRIDFLLDRSEKIGGLKVYGTPWTPHLPGWAFQAEGEKAAGLFEEIPSDLDILISHGPPVGYGDRVSWAGHVGSDELKYAILKKRPKIVITGHIHEGYGLYKYEYGDIYNVSHNNEFYEPINEPVEIIL